jgi:hypothetical protein
MEITFEDKVNGLIKTLKEKGIKYERQYMVKPSLVLAYDSYSGKRKNKSDILYGLTFESNGHKLIFLSSGLHYDDTAAAIEYLTNKGGHE